MNLLPRGSENNERPPFLELAFVSVYGVALSAWFTVGHASGPAHYMAVSCGSIIAAVVAVHAAYTVIRTPPQTAGTNPFCAALLAVACGMVGMALCDAADWAFCGQDPWWLNASYTLSYLFLAAGLLELPYGSIAKIARWQALLDSIAMVAAVLTIVWCAATRALVASAGPVPPETFYGLMFPAGWVALAGTLIALGRNGAGIRDRWCSSAFIAGVALLAIADGSCAVRRLCGAHSSGSMADLGWPLGYLLLTLGASRAHRQRHGVVPHGADTSETLRRLESGHKPHAFAPYFFLPLAAAVQVWAILAPRDVVARTGAAIGTTAIIAATVARQILANAENAHLARLLRSSYERLALRTSEAEDHARRVLALNQELIVAKVEIERRNAELAEANTRLKSLATTDGLTGLANHRVFTERLRAELLRSRRAGQTLAVVLLDVDRFKLYNDTFGHLAGNEALRAVADALRRCVRNDMDTAARYGGEEFAVLLPDTGAMEAQAVGERIRLAVASRRLARRTITVSVGIAQLEPTDEFPDDILLRADQALYAAKRMGRNRVLLHGPDIDPSTTGPGLG